MTEPISLASPSDRSIRVKGEKLWVRSVTPTESGYDIVVARKQFTLPDTDGLSVRAGGKRVPVSAISASRPWDLGNGNVLWKQTYSVQSAIEPSPFRSPSHKTTVASLYEFPKAVAAGGPLIAGCFFLVPNTTIFVCGFVRSRTGAGITKFVASTTQIRP
ncbi:hypothetical protein [Cohnella sp. GCM10027633]|uniref:hypothetical protein n=1 Tax=unclassified Cohnella TaxID=2636738 RepID=UPI00363F9719